MHIVNIHEAKTHLSKLIDEAIHGEPFIIAKAGKPLVKVISLSAPKQPKRLGFLLNQFKVPNDFDTMHAPEIADLFGGHE